MTNDKTKECSEIYKTFLESIDKATESVNRLENTVGKK